VVIAVPRQSDTLLTVTAEELKTLAAAWGAFTGTVALTLTIIALLRDRSRLRMVISEVEREEAIQIHNDLARLSYPSNTFVEVINVGRRVRYVYQPEIWRATEHGLLVPDHPDSVYWAGSWSRSMEAWQTWRLEEGQSVTFVFGNRAPDTVVRIDLPDSLARRKKYFRGAGRLRWHYGRWLGGETWKFMRDTVIERKRTRHHDKD
jgi:hypothetical protein